jgi:hypothetical protein
MERRQVLVENGITDPHILAQARAMITELGGEKYVQQLILMPNARAGLAFAPLSGYLLRCKEDTPFVPSHFNSGTLFSSRTVVQVFDLNDDATRTALELKAIPAPMLVEAVASRIEPEWFVYAQHRAIATGFAILQQEVAKGSEVNQVKLIELVPSHNVQCWAALVDEVKESRVQLVVQTHAMPRNDAFLNNLFTPSASHPPKMTLRAVFEASREMRQYVYSLNVFRAIVTRLLRFYIAEKILGPEAVKRLSHFIDPRIDRRFFNSSDRIRAIRTNKFSADASPTGLIYFHSECYDLVGEGMSNNFGLIMGGPYRELVWANANGQSTEAQLAAKGQATFGGAVPTDMPTTMSSMHALESIALVEQHLSTQPTKAFEEVSPEEFAVAPGMVRTGIEPTGEEEEEEVVTRFTASVEEGSLSMGGAEEEEETVESSASRVASERTILSKQPGGKRGQERLAPPFKTEDGVIVPVLFETRTPEARVPIFTVSHEFLGEISKNRAVVGQHGALRSARARCTLAWASNMDLPVFVPDAVINFRLGVESASVRRTLAQHGVAIEKIDDLTVNPLGRVMMMALGPISPLDQLHIWRATYSALLSAYKRRHHEQGKAEAGLYEKLNTFIAPADEF